MNAVPTVLGRGLPEGSPSARRPELFRWTSDPRQASEEVAVHADHEIGCGRDVRRRRLAWFTGSTEVTFERLHDAIDSYDVVVVPPGHRLVDLASVVELRTGPALPTTNRSSWGVAAKTGVLGAPGPDGRPSIVPSRFWRVDASGGPELAECFAAGTVPVIEGADHVEPVFDRLGMVDEDELADDHELTVELYQSMIGAVRRNLGTVRRLSTVEDLLFTRFVTRAPVSTSFEPADVAAVDLTRSDRGRPPGSDALVRTAMASPKRYVSEAEVSGADRAVKELGTWLRPPELGVGDLRWLDPITHATLFHHADAFIGDNVVFDRTTYWGLDRPWRGGFEQYVGVERVVHVDAALLVAAWGGEAFQHFAVDAVPRLAMMLDLLDEPGWGDVSVVTHWEDAPFAQWILSELGLAGRVVQKPRHPGAGHLVHADLAMSVEFSPAQTELGIVPRGCLRPVQERLGVLGAAPRDRVLYLARPGRIRSVAHEDELLERVEDEIDGTGRSLEVFESCGDPSVDRLAFERAAVVFGPHGGAFANLVFAQPGSHVVEFIELRAARAARREVRPMYWSLTHAAGCAYWAVEPRRFGFEMRDLEVDAARVAALVGAGARAVDP